jgi:uncharacterized protein (TIGR02996 family)
MKSEQALLAAVLASPDDDAPRYAYAEWLTARGDPRGEFIAAQCELRARRKEYDARLGALQKRQNELLYEHRKDWERPFQESKLTVSWGRGFPESLICSPEAFVRGRSLVPTCPFVSLSLLGDAKPVVKELAAAPELQAFRELSLSCGRRDDRTTLPAVLGDAAFGELVRSPYLVNLRKLELGWNDIGVAGLRAFASAPWVAELESLVSLENPLGAEGVRALAAPGLGSLRELNLRGGDVGDVGALALANAGMDRLTFLGLAGARIEAAGAAALAASSSLTRLERLDLSSNRVGDAGAAALAQARMPELRELRLGCNVVGDGGAEALATATERAALMRLDLSQNKLGPAGARAFAASATLSSLAELDLSDNALDLEGVSALAAGTGLVALSKLVLARTVYTDEKEHYSDWDGSDTTFSGPKELESTELQKLFAHKPKLELAR